jgi:hypothetical protein
LEQQSSIDFEKIEVEGQATQRSVVDGLEACYPMLRGTIRNHVTP